MNTSTIIHITLLAILVWSVPGRAEVSDRTKPINIGADKAFIDDAKGYVSYEGNVTLVQGTLSLKASRVEVQRGSHGGFLGTATGNPVEFRQRLESSQKMVEGQANEIKYDTATELLKLQGKAHIKRGEDEISSDVLIYDLKSENFQAGSSTQQGRVKAIIAAPQVTR